MYALVDCNNFFASCERVFNPKLRNVPLAVLSNNDGCIVARSDEVKRLKIPMGAPVFKWRDLIEKNHVQILSANFQLYGDLSNRVIKILRSISKNVQVYSIDEAFIDLSKEHITDYKKYAEFIRKKVLKWVGIPVSVGIAETRTLAKVANESVKTNRGKIGTATVLLDNEEIRNVLVNLYVGELWGVGWRLSKKLNIQGIYTALDFYNLDPMVIHKLGGVMLERTWLELHGKQCISIHTNDDSRKMIMSSRSFGKRITDYKKLRESVVTYVGRAAEKLRAQKSYCSHVTVYLKTSEHTNKQQYYSNAHTASFTVPVSDNPSLIKKAVEALDEVFIDGLEYKKAGVLLSGLIPSKYLNLNLLHGDVRNENPAMDVMDSLNKKFGKNTMIIASQNFNPTWIMKSEHRSPRYTSNWDEIPGVLTN